MTRPETLEMLRELMAMIPDHALATMLITPAFTDWAVKYSGFILGDSQTCSTSSPSATPSGSTAPSAPSSN